MREIFEYDLELEKCVIAAIIIERDAFARTRGLVDSDMFYSDLHKDIYFVCNELFDNSQAIDLAILTQEMYRKHYDDKHELIGHQMSLICNAIASTANLEAHCFYLRELYAKRLLIEIQMDAATDFDVVEKMNEIQGKLQKLREIKTSNDWEVFSEILLKLSIKLQEQTEDGVEIGIRDADQIRGGLQPGEMIVIGARPGVGKTAFAGMMALNIAKANKKVGIVSLEMPNIQLAARIISIVSDVAFWKIDRSKLASEHEMKLITDAIGNTYHLPIFMSEKTGVSMPDIRSKALKLHKKGLDILFIDYLQLLEPEKAKNQNREQQVSSMSRGIKLLAIELNIPIVVLAQLNRDLESRTSKKPKLSDLRESGSIEQDADIVYFLHRESMYSGDANDIEADLIIAKYRNGKTQDIKIGFDGVKMKFFDLGNNYVIQQKDNETF